MTRAGGLVGQQGERADEAVKKTAARGGQECLAEGLRLRLRRGLRQGFCMTAKPPLGAEPPFAEAPGQARHPPGHPGLGWRMGDRDGSMIDNPAIASGPSTNTCTGRTKPLT